VLKQVTAAGITVLAIGCGASQSTHHAVSKPFAQGDCITTSLAAGRYYRTACNDAQYLVITVVPGYPTTEAADKCKSPLTAMPDYSHNVTYCLKG
jgi:hypothetical protein